MHSYQALKDVTNKLLMQCQVKKGDPGVYLDSRIDELDNIPLIHHVFSSYRTTKDEEEKCSLLKLADQILNYGADPNIKNSNLTPIFHRAIKKRDTEFVKLLVNTNRLDYSNQQLNGYKTALQVCIQKWPEYINLIHFLSKKSNNEIVDLFISAISDQEYPMIEYYIKNALIDFNVVNSQGMLPLNLLAIMSNVKLINFILKLLKNSGASINYQINDSKGNNALHLACNRLNNPQLEIIKWLLENKVDPNLPNQNGDAILHIAIENNSPKLVELLIEHGANPACQDALGRTPLMKILMHPELVTNINIVQLLHSPKSIHFTMSTIDPIRFAYERGLWIRNIAAYGRKPIDAIGREVDILNKRDKMSNEILSKHDNNFDIDKHPEYYFSPATFVKAGIPISLFNSTNPFGIIIQTDAIIPAWCSGLVGEIKTDSGNDVDFSAKELKFKYREEHQCQNRTSSEIALHLQRLYEQKRNREDSPLQKYEAIIQTSTATYPYNEGLFRYKKSDVVGFCIETSPEAAHYGLQLRSALNLTELAFYTYTGHSFICLSKQQVLKLAAQFQPKQYDAPIFPGLNKPSRNRPKKLDERNELKRVISPLSQVSQPTLPQASAKRETKATNDKKNTLTTFNPKIVGKQEPLACFQAAARYLLTSYSFSYKQDEQVLEIYIITKKLCLIPTEAQSVLSKLGEHLTEAIGALRNENLHLKTESLVIQTKSTEQATAIANLLDSAGIKSCYEYLVKEKKEVSK